MQGIQNNRVRALAVTSLKRIAQLPAIPTMHETALPNFEVNSWYGLCAPTGTPVPILDKVHPDLSDLNAVLKLPEIQQRLNELVLELAPTTREQFGAFIQSEAARWALVIKDAGIEKQ